MKTRKIMHLSIYINFVILQFVPFNLIQGAPSSSSSSDTIKLCSDLKKNDFMGYKCTPKTECHDSGYILADIDPNILKNGNIDDRYSDDNGLTLSQHKCKNTNDDDYYDDYDYYVKDYSVRSGDISTSDNQMVCCRDPALFKKGIWL